MKIVSHLMLFYLTVHILWFLFREKKFRIQVSAVLVLTMFLLRLLLLK